MGDGPVIACAKAQEIKEGFFWQYYERIFCLLMDIYFIAL